MERTYPTLLACFGEFCIKDTFCLCLARKMLNFPPGNNVEATFDFVEATFDFVAFDNVASTFDFVAGVDGVYALLTSISFSIA